MIYLKLCFFIFFVKIIFLKYILKIIMNKQNKNISKIFCHLPKNITPFNIKKYIRELGTKNLILPSDYFKNSENEIKISDLRRSNELFERKNISTYVYYKDPFILRKKKNTIRKNTLKKIAQELDNVRYIYNCEGFIIMINELSDYKTMKKNISYLVKKTKYEGNILLDFEPSKDVCENEEYIEEILTFFKYLEKKKVNYLNNIKININLQYLYHSGIELQNNDEIIKIINQLMPYMSYISINNSATYPYMNRIEKASIEYGTIPILEIKKIVKIVNENKTSILLDTFGDHNREIKMLKKWSI